MTKSNKRPSSQLVFSTDPEIRRRIMEREEPSTPAVAPEHQVLRIWLERGKGGKEVTLVKGFVGPEDALEEVARWLKNTCATGGSVKEGVIILQGNHRDRVLTLLQERGYKNVKKAGA
ncbi:MAG: translation initiation factor [Saprospiraceae bacterium]|nr:translation initiation factor [Saprospiraceae bacterium]MDW8485032.1 translation initiation factor [Saprospiraceae bacterium]